MRKAQGGSLLWAWLWSVCWLMALLLWLAWITPAQAADPRWYLPMPPTYGAPLTAGEAERRAILREEHRARRTREILEELRGLRNDLEDRAHREQMDRLRDDLEQD